MKIPTIDIKRALCKRSFYYFVKEFIDTIEPNHANFVWNWHLEYLCDVVQEQIFNYTNDLPTKHININICPGTSKSTIFSRMLSSWIWTFAPNITTINVTRSNTNVKNFGIASRQIIDSGKYKSFFNLKIKDNPDAVNYYQNDKQGIRYGLTTNSKESTGKHADIIIFDDVQSYTDIYSEKELEQTYRGLDGYLSRMKNKDSAIIINVMQRLGKGDATDYLFKSETAKLDNYIDVCLPAVANEFLAPNDLESKYIDGLLDPIRLSKETLKKEKKKFQSTYEPQYLQDVESTNDDMQYPFFREDDVDLDLSKAIVFAASDPSGAGADYFCTLFCAIYGNQFFIFDAVYTKDGLNDGQRLLKEKLDKYRPIVNEIETNQDGGLLANILQSNGYLVNPVRESVNKLARIDSYSQFHEQFIFLKKGSDQFQLAKKDIKHFKKNQKTKDDAADTFTKIIRIAYFNYKYLLAL